MLSIGHFRAPTIKHTMTTSIINVPRLSNTSGCKIITKIHWGQQKKGTDWPKYLMHITFERFLSSIDAYFLIYLVNALCKYQNINRQLIRKSGVVHWRNTSKHIFNLHKSRMSTRFFTNKAKAICGHHLGIFSKGFIVFSSMPTKLPEIYLFYTNYVTEIANTWLSSPKKWIQY